MSSLIDFFVGFVGGVLVTAVMLVIIEFTHYRKKEERIKWVISGGFFGLV